MKSKDAFTKVHNFYLQLDIEKLEIYFNKLLLKVGLENKEWEEINFFELEIKKSILRGFLRENQYSNKILTHFFTNI